MVRPPDASAVRPPDAYAPLAAVAIATASVINVPRATLRTSRLFSAATPPTSRLRRGDLWTDMTSLLSRVLHKGVLPHTRTRAAARAPRIHPQLCAARSA